MYAPYNSYATGGNVHPSMINQYAHFLRTMGAGKDKILAHINPEEAHELAEGHGYNVNPHTGLPQFGLWDNIKSFGGNVLGNMFGGGGGASSGAPTGGASPSWGQQLGSAAANGAMNYFNQPAGGASQPMPSFSQMAGDFGRGLMGAGASAAQSYLPKADQFMSQQLPQMASQFGNKYGGQMGGNVLGGLANSFSQNYNQAGGISGAANPYLNYAQGNAPMPTQSLGQTAQNFGSNIGKGMYNQGVGAAQNAVQNFDRQLAPTLQNYGSQFGSQLGGKGGGQFGSDFGGAFGNNLGQAFGQTANQMGGLSSMTQPYLQQYARGGRVKKKDFLDNYDEGHYAKGGIVNNLLRGGLGLTDSIIEAGLPIAGGALGTIAGGGNPFLGAMGGALGTSLSGAYSHAGGLSSLMGSQSHEAPSNMNQPQGGMNSYSAGMMPSYARGGSVSDPHEMADKLSHYGRHGDTMLAHINPEEADMLESMGGSGTINPHTGLPEYWGLGDIWHAISEPFKKIIKPVKKFVGPVLGSGGGAILGNMLLPGLGGVLGGLAGGAAGGSFGHPNQRMGPMGGALMGAALPTVAGGLGSLASHAGATGLGGALTSYGNMAGLSNALPYLGMGGAVNAAGSMPFSTHAPTHLAHTLASRGGSGGLLSSLGNLFGGGSGGGMGGMGGISSLLGPALLGATALGTMNRKVKYEYPKGTSLQEELSRNGLPGMDEENEYDVDIPDRHYREPSSSHSPESEWQFYDQVNPFTNMKVTKRKKKKYYEGGYLDHAGGGQDDDLNINVSGGEYIIPADVVSDVGDGNNAAGGKKYDQMVANVRKHKGRKKFPPKAKKLESYMR